MVRFVRNIQRFVDDFEEAKSTLELVKEVVLGYSEKIEYYIFKKRSKNSLI